jgi:hypothetical protein
MALDPGHPMTGDVAAGMSHEQPPHTLARPADAPPPLSRLADAEAVRRFRAEYSSQHEPRASTKRRSLRAIVRTWAGRVSGRADRRLIVALASATDAVVERCDAIADRLGSQEGLTSDVTESFGSELAYLRAEVAHLRAQTSSQENQRRE